MRDLMEKFGWDVPYIPMNVKNAETKIDKLFADDDYVAELKRDGSRYVSIEGRFFSRKKSENKKSPETLGLPVEKTANVPHLAEFFRRFPGMIVEGEIFYPGGKSNIVTSIMGCDPAKALMRQGIGQFDHFPAPKAEDPSVLMWRLEDGQEWQKIDKATLDFIEADRGAIHYMLFEMTYIDGKDMRDLPWLVRRQELEHWYEQNVEGTEYAQYISLSTPWEGETAKRALLKWAEDNREEGIVFKNRHSTYQCDKRPEHHWYRVKGKVFADVVLMSYEPPTAEYKGKELSTWRYWEFGDGQKKEFNGSSESYAYQGSRALGVRPVTKNYFYGWIGSIKFGLYKLNTDKNSPAYDCMELVEAGTCDGMPEDVIQTFTSEGSSLIGTVIEISAMERTEKGKFRHPNFERFRDDKNAEDCLWDVEGAE